MKTTDISEALGCIKGADTFRLWTVQSWQVWEEFQRKKVLRCDGRRIVPDLRFAYRWMMHQMAKRISGCSGKYPIWAWYYPKPDLRGSGYLPYRARGVRIEFCVPRGRVLLSCFDAWHSVLNPCYFGWSEAEDDAWDARIPQDKWRNLFERYSELPHDLRQEMEESWERIFDLETLRACEWTGPLRYTQAVIEEVRPGEVVEVKEFRAR